jgi:hypothetical protein
MAKQDQTLTRHDLEAKIVKRCWEDEGFRKEFTADPAAAFVKYLEIPAASLPKISVHQEEPGSWHIVLPAKPADTNEISEQDLDRIAGAASGIILQPNHFFTALAAAASVTAATAIASAGMSATISQDW